MEKLKPVISIITPYYNAEKYIEETAKSVLSQTFPYYEWIIVDDGSSKQAKEKLREIEKLDDRIRIFWRDNLGVAQARDFGILNSAKTSKYIVFLDADDLYNKTFLECAYWTLETHPEASWAYTDSINFGARNFLWRKWYDTEWEKEENILIVSSCIRKEALQEVGGFGVKEKRVYEDWYLWLKLINKGKYPVRMNSLLTYYRQKEENSELKNSNQNNKENALRLVNKIKSEMTYIEKEAIQFPKYDYNWEEIKDENTEINKMINGEGKKIKDTEICRTTKENDGKINILMIVPWLVTGGADKFNLNLVSKLDKNKFDFTIITTLPAKNEWRRYFEQYATIYDLTTFLEMKDWVSFINYIIEKNKINLIFNTNSQFGYKILPYLKSRYPKIPIIDYVHIEEWYWRNGGYSRDSSILQNIIDKTYTCNENSRNIFIKEFGRKKSEVKTVYVGVDEKSFKRTTQRKNEKYTIAFICRIVDQKRPYLFFEVIKELSKTRQDFVAIIAGDGQMLKGLKEKVAQNKLEDFFKFVGNVKNTKKIYEISDISVNTSIKEGVALTSYESLAMEVPVVSADVGGQKELITEDVGVVVPCIQKETEILNFNYTKEEIRSYVNAINTILENLEQYKTNCRKRIVENFTIDKMIKTMEKEFEKVTKNPNEEKIRNGEYLTKNQEILKELISTYFESSKGEYMGLANEFNIKNVHKVDKYDKKAKKMIGYEHTLEYKIKHSIVVVLRKIGIYDPIKDVLHGFYS